MDSEVQHFVEGINKKMDEYCLDDDALWAFDESSIESGGVPPTTFVDQETRDSSVLESCPARRDTLVLAVNGKGERYHNFIEHKPAHIDPETGRKVAAVKGLHIEHMQPFINGVASNTAGDPALMIQVNLQARHNPEVILSWIDRNIEPEFLPPQSAKYASVLDRSIFSVAKSRLRHIPYTTIDEKRAAIDEVVSCLEPGVIRKMWCKCGYKLKADPQPAPET
jgi:hypothetical protein